MPELATKKIIIQDLGAYCNIALSTRMDGVAFVGNNFVRDETVEIERVLHEFNERHKP